MLPSFSSALLALFALSSDAAATRIPRRGLPVDPLKARDEVSTATIIPVAAATGNNIEASETGSPAGATTVIVTHTNFEFYSPSTSSEKVSITNHVRPINLHPTGNYRHSNFTIHNSTGFHRSGTGHISKSKHNATATPFTPSHQKVITPATLSSAPSTRASAVESPHRSSQFARSVDHSSSAKASATRSSYPSSTHAADAPSGTANATIPFLRGVNLGGWLILEKWMNSDVFTGVFSGAVDQWTFDAMPGAQAALEKHWSTYYTESDIQDLAKAGINALRIPIGYWAYDNSNSHYIKGADAYMEKAIGWARNAGMKVWVDCHGSPGSQNGQDHSGHKGLVQWQTGANREQSISVLQTMATKYGSEEYADVVVGLEVTNEPLADATHSLSDMQQWTKDAYAAVKAAAKNPNMVIIMHDAFQDPSKWTGLAKDLGPKDFGMDSHMYQLYTDADNELTQAQHITKACGWASDLSTLNDITPSYVGEWTGVSNVCLNTDGSTTAGSSCSKNGCRCLSDPYNNWSSDMVDLMRKYVEAQLDVFEKNTSGYFLWSAKGPGSWSFLDGIKKGTFPSPVTSRKFPGQCGGKQRRATRGSLGREPETF